MKNKKIDSEDEAKPESVFERFRKNTLKKNIQFEFDSRTRVTMPNIFHLFIGFICCRKRYSRINKLFRIGKQKITHDLDVVNIIKKSRLLSV